jgi:hypothetical protein
MSWLIGRGVFKPDASFVGKVIAVKMDAQKRPTVLTQTTMDSALELGWDLIAGGRDILILKPGFDPSKLNKVALPLSDAARKGWDVGSIPKDMKKQPGEARNCPTCGNKAEWIGEYGRWYCLSERKYL